MNNILKTNYRKALAGVIDKFLCVDNEKRLLLRSVKKIGLSKDSKIIDVGCGFGKNLTLFKKLGLDALGVEINDKIVEANRAAGFNCVSVNEFEKDTQMYDLILMSHVIEHFQPHNLLQFIDRYLDKLNDGGYLIIATPLMSEYFFDDFDHVKPYHPVGINMVFCSHNSQVQYYSKNSLECLNVQFRRNYFRKCHFSGFFERKKKFLPLLINIGFAFMYRISFGLFGKVDGWIGTYRKVKKA